MNGNAKSAAAKQLRADEALRHTPPPTTHTHLVQQVPNQRERGGGGRGAHPDLKSVQGEATCKRKRKILCYSFGFSTLLAKQAATRLDWFTQQPPRSLLHPSLSILVLSAYSLDPLGRAFICSVQSCRLCWIRVACVVSLVEAAQLSFSYSRSLHFASIMLKCQMKFNAMLKCLKIVFGFPFARAFCKAV